MIETLYFITTNEPVKNLPIVVEIHSSLGSATNSLENIRGLVNEALSYEAERLLHESAEKMLAMLTASNVEAVENTPEVLGEFFSRYGMPDEDIRERVIPSVIRLTGDWTPGEDRMCYADIFYNEYLRLNDKRYPDLYN